MLRGACTLGSHSSAIPWFLETPLGTSLYNIHLPCKELLDFEHHKDRESGRIAECAEVLIGLDPLSLAIPHRSACRHLVGSEACHSVALQEEYEHEHVRQLSELEVEPLLQPLLLLELLHPLLLLLPELQLFGPLL